ncbi:MAG: hypothetical protein RIE73_04035 [Coleofasciculus sp. C1-SOL-03]|uniref:hypothetical protein n=1 Tax=Coleofasciculus sp. C1-SOL-03 TaxID=3069522 RepID=UPI0032F89533
MNGRGIGHEPEIDSSTALVWINPSSSATRNPGRNRMGRLGGSLTIVKGFVANWQGEEGEARTLSGGRPDTIELTGIVN